MNDFDFPPARAKGDPGSGGRPRPRRRRPVVVVVASLAVAAAVAASVVAIDGTRSPGRAASRSAVRSGTRSFIVAQAGPLARPATAAAIAARVDPGLVNIDVSNASTGTAGQATGMVLTPTGVVLTNNHVIQGATSIRATDVGSGRTYGASVVGYDRSGDVAVIQLHAANGLQTVPLGDSSTVSVGAPVTALGNAGGGGGTPRRAAGAVTALGQGITASDIGGGNAERLAGLIQTNAAVVPGDSGGPLVNDAAQVIGMDAAASTGNTSYVAQPTAAQAFAIPLDSALAIARQIEAGAGSATVHIGPTGFLGVEVVPSSPFGYGFGNASASQPRGALLGGVLSGYPAARIGLSQGDLITAVDGHTVSSATALTDLLFAHHSGDLVQLRWSDAAGNAHSATVKLASGPPA